MFHYHILDRTKGVNLKHTLLSGEVLLYDLGYTDSRGGIDFPHSHPFHEFYLVISGVACIITENTSRMLREGEILYVAPGTRHCFDPEGSRDCGYVNFAFDWFPSWPEAGSELVNHFPEFAKDERFLIDNLFYNGTRQAVDTCGCRQEIEHIIGCLEQTYLGDLIKLASYEICFLISALQNFSTTLRRDDFPAIDRQARDRTAVKAMRIAQYIWDHSGQELTIERAAEDLNYSKRHIQRILAGYYAIGFSKLLSHYRVARLKIALRSGEETVERFAERCGYSDTKSLSRSFREVTGITISQYKRDLRRGGAAKA